MRRLTVSLPVDNTTARRFARSCRREAVWQRVGLPVVFVVGAVVLMSAVIGVARYDTDPRVAWTLAALASWVGLFLSLATILVTIVLRLQRSRHHPVLTSRGRVLVRGVDWQTARAWAELNPAGSVELLG